MLTCILCRRGVSLYCVGSSAFLSAGCVFFSWLQNVILLCATHILTPVTRDMFPCIQQCLELSNQELRLTSSGTMYSLRITSALMAAATSVLYFPDAAAAKAVFAHYMVRPVSTFNPRPHKLDVPHISSCTFISHEGICTTSYFITAPFLPCLCSSTLSTVN